MKTYSRHNFFKDTYCEFTLVDPAVFQALPVHYKSKSGSSYSYTKEGVYRFSNHWGRVADCRWKLQASPAYKNQQYQVGYAAWDAFYSLTSTERVFSLQVDFEAKKVKMVCEEGANTVCLFTAMAAKKRIQEIQHLLSETAWARYFPQDIATARQLVVQEMVQTNTSLQQIKRACRALSA